MRKRRFDVEADMFTRTGILFISGSFSYIILTLLKTETRDVKIFYKDIKRNPSLWMFGLLYGVYATFVGLAYPAVSRMFKIQAITKTTDWSSILRCLIALVGTYQATYVSFRCLCKIISVITLIGKTVSALGCSASWCEIESSSLLLLYSLFKSWVVLKDYFMPGRINSR